MILDKLKINCKNAWRFASVWAATGSGFAGAVWMSLTRDDQAAVLSHLFVPGWLIPPALAGIIIAARVWPQKSVTPQVAAAKSQDVLTETDKTA